MTTKTALITGASSGIGFELARLFAADGYALVLVARDPGRLEEAAERVRSEHGGQVVALARDLARPSAPDEVAAELGRRGISVDVLVNNAGFNVYGPFAETDAERELTMLQVNVVALTRLTKLLLSGMLERRSGRILNLGSTGSFACGPLDAVYCASKAYVLSFSEALAEELEGSGVTVTALCPGATDTSFAQRADMLDTAMFSARTADPTAVALAGYRGMQKGRRVVVPGLKNALLTLSIRFSPRAMVAGISKTMLSRVEVAR